MSLSGKNVIRRVLSAAHDLRLEDGFAPKEVINYIASNYGVDREQASRRVYAALRRGASDGVFRLRKGRYAVGATTSFSDMSEFQEPQDCGILTEPDEPKTKIRCKRRKSRRRHGCTKMWTPRRSQRHHGRRGKSRSRGRRQRSKSRPLCKRRRSKSRRSHIRRRRPKNRSLCKRRQSKSHQRRKARKNLCHRRKSQRRRSRNRRRGKGACKRGKSARKRNRGARKRPAKKPKSGQKRKNLCKPKQAPVGCQESISTHVVQKGVAEGSCVPPGSEGPE